MAANVLLSHDRQILLNCSRQSGKSTVVSAWPCIPPCSRRAALVLLLSPSQRQSTEIFRKVLDAYKALGRPLPARQQTQLRLELANGSRVLCLPGREETIRSFGGVNLLVLDEAARIPDDLYRSVRPMLAVSQGRLVALSTPFGQRGWFWQEWESDGPWKKIRITWRDCPRITPSSSQRKRGHGPVVGADKNMNALFTALEGLVYPDFERRIVDDPAGARRAGASAASTSAGAIRSRHCGACSTATMCCGSPANAICPRDAVARARRRPARTRRGNVVRRPRRPHRDRGTAGEQAWWCAAATTTFAPASPP